MGRTPFRDAPRSTFVAAFSALLVLNATGWIFYGQWPGTALAAETSSTEPSASSGAEAHGGSSRVTLRAALPTLNVGQTDRLIVAMEGLDVAPDRAALTEMEAGSVAGSTAGPAAGSAREPILDAPFLIEPALEGTWTWDGPDRLAFLLEEPLGDCRTVRMRPTAALESLLGRAVDADFEAIWTSAPLQVKSFHAVSMGVETVTVQFELNAELEPKELLAALTVRAPGSPDALTLTPVALPALAHVRSSGASAHRFRFRRPADDATHVEVTLDHPLRDLGGKRLTKDRGPMLLEVPRRFALIRKTPSLASDSTTGRIEVHFNRALDPEARTPEVTVQPSVPHFSVRPSGGQLVLEGEFEPEMTYTVTLPENVLASNGETLRATAPFAVQMPRRKPDLKIPAWRGTLSPLGNLSLELHTTAVSAVKVTAQKVLPGNLVEHVRGTSRRYTSTEVLAKTYVLPSTSQNAPRSTHVLDLAELLKRDGESLAGVYDIHVAATDSRWTRDYATVRISDLGTTAKRTDAGLHLWVHSIATGQPVTGATVTALSVKDQTLGQATTDQRGHAFIECPRRASDGAESDDLSPYLAIIESEADTAYLELQSSAWDVPRAVASGRSVPAVADVFAYTERSLYRPGDTIYLTGIARTVDGIVHARPIDVRLTRPDGAVMLEQPVQPDPAQGVFHLSYEPPSSARTGTWEFTFTDAATGEPIGRTRFGVEAFLPARMSLTATSSHSKAEAGQLPRSTVSARSLAGTSTEGFEAEVSTRWSPLRFSSTRYPLFSFQPESDERSTHSARTSARLASDGSATVDLPGFEKLAAGLWRASSSWSVTEPGSRSATAATSVNVDTASRHRGLRIDRFPGLSVDASGAEEGAGAGVVRQGVPFHVLALAVAPSDSMVAADGGRELFVSLDRIDTSYELGTSGNGLRWARKVTVTAVSTHALAADDQGVFHAEASCPSSGEYRLTLRGKDDPYATVLEFHAAEDPDRFRPTSPAESVVVTPETASASPGTHLAFQIESPFDGSALVTAEDHRLRWQGRVEVVNGRAEVELPIPSDVRGGLVISCQVTRPLEAAAKTWRPHRAYGWTRVPTDHRVHELAVTLSAPARVRPGELATVTVEMASNDARPRSGARRPAVHLWAVDEGLRLAGGHRTPRPLRHFLGARAFRGRTTDTWSTLLPDLDLPGAISRIGGDSDLARSARRRAPEEVHLVPAIVWNEAVPMGEDGRMTTTLRVPDFTGTLTWMAVVVDQDRYGSGEAATTVAGEIPLTLGLPRFAAPGDELQLHVAFENTTDAVATVQPRLELSGAGMVAGSENADAVRLGPGERHVARFNVTAVREGRIEGRAWLDGTFDDGRAVAERVAIDLPVRSGRPRITASRTFSVDASEGISPSLDLSELLGIDLAEREHCELRVSASPGLELLAAGAYLTDYPHGCAEQTASRIFAALSTHALRARTDDSATALAEVADRVTRGFLRLASMQTEDGGIGYWPGHTSSSPWASLYVAEVVAASTDLGFKVPGRLRERLAQHVDARLRAARSLDERARLV
ncbi:MAG: hypothetical protein ACI80K_003693, partial [Paracoccaceae bacterium]